MAVLQPPPLLQNNLTDGDTVTPIWRRWFTTIQNGFGNLAAIASSGSASDLIAGLVSLTRGGTGANLSATGGTHQFLKQSSAGAVITVGQPAAGDVSGLAASATTDTTNASNITSGTLAAARLPTRATFVASPGNPVGTTSTTRVMMGLGSTCTITPNTTGTVRIHISGVGINTGSTTGFGVRLMHGTGTAPVNGVAETGSSNVQGINISEPISTDGMFFSQEDIMTGLTVGTAVWFDISLAAVTSGTATIVGLNATALELN